MTVETTQTKVFATLNGVATVFSFNPLVIFQSSDLVVTLVDASGNETVLSEGTGTSNYSVSVSAYPGTGSITYPATGSAANNGKLVMKRALVIQQTTDLENQGGYFPDTQETALDRLTMVDLQQQELIDRSLKLPVSDASSPLDLPTAALRAGKGLVFDGAGNPTVGTLASVAVSAPMTPVVQAASLALGRTAFGLGSSAVLSTGTQTQVDAATAGIVPTADQLSDRLQHGQCRLSLQDATHIILKPYNGNKVFIPSSGLLTLPAAGLQCAVGAALVEGGTPGANTLYYAYLSAAGGGTLQLSATGHSTDATTGVEIRTGDNTRILVGMVQTNGSVQFVDSGAARNVASYFNRQTKFSTSGVLGVSGFSTSGAWAAIGGGSVGFLAWADEAAEALASGYMQLAATSNSQVIEFGIASDAAVSPNIGALQAFQFATAPSFIGLFAAGLATFAEGYHTFNLQGFTASTNQVVWNVALQALVRS